MTLENEEMEKNILDLDKLLEVLGNSTRRAILAKLSKIPHSPSELAGTLNITRQAIHSQINKLKESGLIEDYSHIDERKKYRIKKNISTRIDISPDYFNIKYSIADVKSEENAVQLTDMKCAVDYNNITELNSKARFLGQQLKGLEISIKKLESNRRELLRRKECFIIELKHIMEEQYKKQLIEKIEARHTKLKNRRVSLNLGEEIFFTLFYNSEKYSKKFTIDKLIDDLFFAKMDFSDRAQSRTSIQPLLRDLSKMMGFLIEDNDDWFFRF